MIFLRKPVDPPMVPPLPPSYRSGGLEEVLPGKETVLMTKRSWPGVLAFVLAILGATRTDAMSLAATNMVDLLHESDAIVVGQVAAVTDGIDERGIPFTEVKIEISETIRGDLSGTYTFRQFGLLNPRTTADGKWKMMPAPTGFPRFVPGEQNVLFLHPVAGWTGLRTTAGLSYGKFVLGPGRVENDMANAGLFRNIRLEPGLTTAADRGLLMSDGAANPEAFLSFVRRAVRGRWVETGRMTKMDRRAE